MKSKSEYQFYDVLEKHFSEHTNVMEVVQFLPYGNYELPKINGNCFIVYEDWWIRKPKVVLSKINSILGQNKRIFARKTKVRRINKEVADNFLEKHHIYGATKSKHKYGLFLEKELLSVATFSGQRNLEIGRSGELIRYCTKGNITVVGGLDKLLKHYEREMHPEHIMTYIDLEWGKGESFRKIGFTETERKASITYWINPCTGDRSRIPTEKHTLEIKNKGSLKMERFYTK